MRVFRLTLRFFARTPVALGVVSVCIFGCQNISQKADTKDACQGRDSSAACEASAPPKNIAQIYPKHFPRDPHARHKAKALAVGLDAQETHVTFSANNPDYKHRNYTQSVIAPHRHEPRVVRYNEAPGMVRVRSGNLQFDALFSLAQTTLHKTSRQSFLGENYQADKACDCFVLRDTEGERLLPLALAGDLSLALSDPKKMQRSLLYYLSGFRSGIRSGIQSDVSKYAAVPGDEDGFQIADFAGAGDAWPLSSDRVFWAWPLQAALLALPDSERDGFSRDALRALRNTIEIDRAVLFDGSDGLYGGHHNIKNIHENLAYYHALKLTARLAKQHNDVVHSVKYLDWSVDLKNAINQNFWNAKAKAYQSYSKNDAAVNVIDWQAQTWALLLGVASEAQQHVLATYLPDTQHFYSAQSAAYSLRAAQLIQHRALADRAYRLLVDNASMHLGFASPWSESRENSRHSQHELVAASAYQSMVVHSLFGLQVQEKGLAFYPLITSEFRRSQFAAQSSIALYDVALRGRTFDIKITLPQVQPQDGIYRIASIRANGRRIAPLLHWHEMEEHNSIVIRLGALNEDSTVYQPFAAKIAPGDTHSLASAPIAKRATLQRINMSDKRVSTKAERIGRGDTAYLKQWGAPRDSIHITDIQLPQSGRYTLQWQYRNPAHRNTQGIAQGVKWLSVTDANGNVLFGKAVLMPLQSPGAKGWVYSLPLSVTLPAGSYALILRDFMNMSYLEVNMAYTGKGGAQHANHIDIRALRIDRDASSAQASKKTNR